MSILIYDDSFEGLLTSIYDAFYSKHQIDGIYGLSQYNAPLLLGEIKNIETDLNKFEKVRNSIINKIDLLCLQKIYMVYLSNVEDKGMVIFKYLKSAFKYKKNIHAFLHIDIVRQIDEIKKRVSFEAHKFKGFVRFKSIDNNFLYCSIEPDNNILELIGDHFMKRFSNEYWIIHDISRNKAIIYDTNKYEIIELLQDDCKNLLDHKDEYSSLWKCYFKFTTIEERKNLRLQRQMMPKRYWKHIFETS
ncbi:TIGR03915 family putative DNA repair protein [Clostridium butyricum]|uniref:TIGR03915 family putative DNA repair protein n=1 Tax=Clostridium butyricum TaxID=1492 RepID=UPI002911CB5F|nr:TIGR03915 family putative DNA repair protein [Clostridium butyricum]MDU3596714.1 TIGR03915 family putative DNA repair protein [Clostridium butyricum]MDU4752739.1 TIGR03915 family putative DNA repair protein [Clostridium butyricum]